MNHSELEELLGAFALDAVDPDQARELEAHLADCPKCRAEVQAHRETAAMIASGDADVPTDLWERISRSIADGAPIAAVDAGTPPLAVQPATALRRNLSGRSLRDRTPIFATIGLVAAAVAAIIVLSVQVSGLDSRVDRLNTALGRAGISGVVAQASLAPHATIDLKSSRDVRVATVIVTKQGTAYWVTSSLRELSATRTYQLWGLSHGHFVSLGLVGPNPHRFASFRIEAGTKKVLVTVEPEGGTPAPTSPAVASGSLGSTV